MFVKPATGLVIPDPDRGGVLPAEGRDVPPTEFWRRRLRDGDVVAATAPIAEPPPAPPSPPPALSPQAAQAALEAAAAAGVPAAAEALQRGI